MDSAINKTTNQIVNALFLDENLSYPYPDKEVWYADPNDILSYDKDKVSNIKQVEVRYRKGNDKVINKFGTEYVISPCFFIPNKTELGINIVPESKEHKQVKNWIYNKIKNKKLTFKFSRVTRPFQYDNELTQFDLDIDYTKIGVEVVAKNNKTQRADIIIPFNKFNQLLGFGIVIEIQFSKQYETTTEKRNIDWAFKGYSICWIWDTDFKTLEEDILELKDEDKLILFPNESIVSMFREEKDKELKLKLQEFSRLIDKKIIDLNFPFFTGECKVCNKGYMTIKRSKLGSRFYGCSNWKGGCQHTIAIPNEYDTD